MAEATKQKQDEGQEATAQKGPATAQKGPAAAQGARGTSAKQAFAESGGLREFLTRLFGTELAAWGMRTGTLDSGLLGRSSKPHPILIDRFPNLNDKQILATSKAFKTALSKGWEALPPATYNGMRYGFEFFLELVQIKGMFGKDPAAKWLAKTASLQKKYMTFLACPEGREAITVDVPSIVERYQEGPQLLKSARPVLHYLADLDSLRPTLRNSIIAMHSLAEDRLLKWEEVLAKMAPPEPETRKYLPPSEYAADLYNHVHNAKDRFGKAQGRIKEIDRIENQYLKKNAEGIAGGEIWTNAFQTLQRLMPDEPRFADPKRAVQHPQLAIYALCKYMYSTYQNLLSGTIKVRPAGSNIAREVSVFRSEVFTPMLENLERLVSSCERAVKAYRDATMEYQALDPSEAEKDTDPFRRYVRELADRGNKIWRNLTVGVEAVLASHRATEEREKRGKEVDPRGKEIPIEELSRNARFLPYADDTIAYGGLSQKTTREALAYMVQMLYVGRYMFRDVDLIRMLESKPDLLREQEDAYAELQRMGEQL